jgi:hypothetical protein
MLQERIWLKFSGDAFGRKDVESHPSAEVSLLV